MTSIRIGGHGDDTDPIAEAKARGGDLAQFFLGDPQSWKGPTISYAGGAAALKADAEAAGIDLYVHSPYPLNVASTNNRIRIPSRKLLQQVLNAAAEVGRQGRDRARRPRAAVRRPGQGLRQLAQVHRRAGHAGPAADREHRRRRQRDGAPDGADRDALGRDRRGRAAATPSASASTPAMRTPAARSWRPWSTGSRRSPAGSTWCTPTTRATSSTPAPTGTPTSARATSTPTTWSRSIRSAGAPVVCETPGGTDGQAADIAWLKERALALGTRLGRGGCERTRRCQRAGAAAGGGVRWG